MQWRIWSEPQTLVASCITRVTVLFETFSCLSLDAKLYACAILKYVVNTTRADGQLASQGLLHMLQTDSTASSSRRRIWCFSADRNTLLQR